MPYKFRAWQKSCDPAENNVQGISFHSEEERNQNDYKSVQIIFLSEKNGPLHDHSLLSHYAQKKIRIFRGYFQYPRGDPYGYMHKRPGGRRITTVSEGSGMLHYTPEPAHCSGYGVTIDANLSLLLQR